MLALGLSLTLLAARPDVILVTIDTLRADHVGAYGSTRGATPAIDALAKAGVVVQEAVVQVPLTRPSHVSIMTGLLPFQHGVRDNASPPLDRSVATLASTMKAAGYATAAFIGAYPVSRSSGLDRGFDVFDDPFVADSDPQVGAAGRNERPAREVSDAALAWLAKPALSPRFVWIHFFEPHYPYEPPPPFATRFKASPYDGEVATADAELKRLLDAYPPGASRVVVVTSDHGEGLGDHGEDEHHLFVYDSTLRVPLIVAGGDLPRGGSVKGQFRSIDLMPSVLDLVGLKSPPLTGVSRAQNLRTGVAIPDNESYAESLYGSIHFGYAPVRALRGEGFKYIDTPRAELYRVATDPAELTNLAMARAPLSAAMQKQLRQIHGEDAKRPVTLAPVDQAAQERLAALGYVAGGAVTAASNPSQLSDPKDRLAQYNRYSRGVNAALLARRHRDPAVVVKALMPLAPEFGANATVSSFLGEALLETKRFAEAIPFLEKARDGSPGAWARWGHLAEAYAGAGQMNEALDATEKGMAASPKATDLIRLRAVLLSRAGRAAEAARFLEGASASNPEDGLLLAEVASLRRNSGDLRAADALSARAVTLAPQKADAWLSRGLVLGALGRITDAGQAFAQAAQIDPKSADAWFYAATVEIQKGNPKRASELLNRVRELDPGRRGLSEAIAAARGASPPAASSPSAPAARVMSLRLIRAADNVAATAALSRIEAGEAFADVARAVSIDPSSEKGGDLGSVSPSDLSEPLRSIVAKLRVGEISSVVGTAKGYVIVKRER